MSRATAWANPAAEDLADAHYKLIPITAPDSPYAVADGINNDGLVTGYYADASFNYHGFIWKDGVFQTVNYPGAAGTLLYGVNNSGIAIGFYGDGTADHAVTYSVASGRWGALPDIPGYLQNQGYCINDEGVAVGLAFGATTSVAWIWDPHAGSYSFFVVPGSAAYTTSPSCINDRNEIAGYYADDDGVYHGFLKQYGTYTIINFPGAADTFPDGVNDEGTIQGEIIDATGAADGFVGSSRRGFTIVDYPGAGATAIVGINDLGVLCGAYGGAGFATPVQAFVAIPRVGP